MNFTQNKTESNWRDGLSINICALRLINLVSILFLSSMKAFRNGIYRYFAWRLEIRINVKNEAKASKILLDAYHLHPKTAKSLNSDRIVLYKAIETTEHKIAEIQNINMTNAHRPDD